MEAGRYQLRPTHPSLKSFCKQRHSRTHPRMDTMAGGHRKSFQSGHITHTQTHIASTKVLILVKGSTKQGESDQVCNIISTSFNARMWVCYGETHKVLMWDNSVYYRCSSKSLLLRLQLNAWLFPPVLWKQKPFWGQTHSDNSDQMTETHGTYWLHVAVSQQTITTCKTTRPSAGVSSVSTNWQICRCIVHLHLGTWKCFPCNHIPRKTVGKPQAVMWNKCHTSVCTKNVLFWTYPTNLSRWCEWVRQVGGQPGGGGWQPPSHLSR